ncbi:MAG: hypothetical protein ACTS5Y_02455 [Pollutimonas bauzanensis]|uniref:Uncharacterized protein n=1 Tax=Pollutimonas bauzanensis TaxID=658167 RepID=A0A1M5SZ72_9BURK|nr:hypothetical protein [Pollutimonas bauzanensis]SHH43794.1 hypothetical protein SAMN04488135_103227 [Pollutimonas bauzanensis]
MTTWYILPNGNIKHANGLELQPEQDWFPTTESMERFTERGRGQGLSDVQIIKHMMDLARDCEKWVQDNLR